MLTIQDGKFFKDGQPVPIEFGNKEQIALISKIDKALTQGITPHFNVLTSRTAYLNFICVCNTRLFAEHEDEEEIQCFKGEIFKCRNCGRKWEAVENPEDDSKLLIKIRK